MKDLPELTEQETAEAIIEGRLKKFFHQKAIENGITWDTDDPRFGRTLSTDKYRRPRQNDFRKPSTNTTND